MLLEWILGNGNDGKRRKTFWIRLFVDIGNNDNDGVRAGKGWGVENTTVE